MILAKMIKERIVKCVRQCLPTTTKTCIWIAKLTIGVSFGVMLLKFIGILPWISTLVYPVFSYLGLPGDAALVYISGYFVNVYSSLAVLSTCNMDFRAITILGTMVLCSHSMILETAVLKKIGANGTVAVILRTFAAFFLGWILNLVLPGEGAHEATTFSTEVVISWEVFGEYLSEWALSAVKLVGTLVVVIYTLNILQRILTEFGIMDILTRPLKPVMAFFGLSRNVSFLWLVCNVVGLGYGAAALLDELERGKLTRDEVQLLSYHVSISHSNVEDLLLYTFAGGTLWVMLTVRWAMSFAAVWSVRLVRKFALR